MSKVKARLVIDGDRILEFTADKRVTVMLGLDDAPNEIGMTLIHNSRTAVVTNDNRTNDMHFFAEGQIGQERELRLFDHDILDGKDENANII